VNTEFENRAYLRLIRGILAGRVKPSPEVIHAQIMGMASARARIEHAISQQPKTVTLAQAIAQSRRFNESR
jgi:hypothetical protein